MATVELYTKGATVWIPDPDCVWVSAQILESYRAEDKHLLLLLNDGREARCPAASPGELPPLGNPDILEGENDLTALSFLHEPAVLHNLRVRFLDYNSIYTYCGIVLVAINPYDQLPIYGKEVIDAYSGQDMTDMEPHIFAVAEEAYCTMTREEKNQSIIISGESGSGKTVSAKFTMRYLAVVGGASEQTSVEERVLASNPIMESIGNAKTTRNDNSSRFGKYIEIGFGGKGEMFGANMRTYLLEKSRVVFQASSERNYHVFYQLCASRALPEMRALRLDAPEQFRYTNQGGDIDIPDNDDMANLECTRNAFTILGVQPHQQMELFTILAAVLHLGNVNIQASSRGGDRSYIDPADRSLAVFSKLLGVDGPQMAHWLCHRRLAVGGEMLVKPMAGQQALEARDALAKHIYGQLFTWTVHRLNSALHAPRGRPKSFIGVLDIYGFETFDRNSFEQFCINYANEKLQQQFNRHVFHLEQEEYVREELAWSRIEFSDNQPCIGLIEGHLGLLDLLDEECRMPKGSDENWARKLYDQHQSSNPHPHFCKPRMSNSAFILLHFADAVSHVRTVRPRNVQYECGGFLDKNKDTIFEEPINILRASQSELVAELFQQLPPGDSESQSGGTSSSLANGSLRSGKRGHKEHKLTVGFQFRQSLQLLMGTLNSTTPHYVRCIKPNDLKEPFVFDPKRAVQQLRACGVLETIRISAAGYPSRWTYEEFFNRYRVLLRGEAQNQEQVLASCRRVLPQLIPDPEQYCFGKTKVFFRAGQVALLERLRAERLRRAGVVIQSWVRGWLARLRYSRVRWAARTIQRYCRGALARRLALTLRYTRAALVIQKTYRMVAVRQLFLTIRHAALTIQAFTRGTLARRRLREERAERAAVMLQARVRGWLARCAYGRVRWAVVLTQCCVRRRAARRQLLKLKAEARSVEKYRQLNKGMEVKLMQLQLRADQEARESASLKETLHSEREAHGAELEALRRAVLKLEKQNEKREAPKPPAAISEKELEERRRAEEKAAQEILRLTQEKQALQSERDVLVKEKEELSLGLHKLKEAQDECVRQAVSRSGGELRAELDEERRKYQGLLREFTRLEQRYDNLREMSLLTERTKAHRRTDSTQSLGPEPSSPGPSSPCVSFAASPFPSGVPPSPETDRRVSVTGPPGPPGCPGLDRMCSAWSPERLMDPLMERMGVARASAMRMTGEDLGHAYDAVRVANKSDVRELLEAQELECVRLRRELKELRATVTLRRLLAQPEVLAPPAPHPTPQDPRGLLKCRKRDEAKLIKNLITDVRVDSALSLPAGLAASVLFMCARHMDYSGDHSRAHAFCSNTVTAMKAALKKHSSDVNMTALWLKNACLLNDLFMQHSPKKDGTPGSEGRVPLTSDLSDVSHALSNLCIQAYQQLLSLTEARLHPIIVPAMLESETIAGLSSSVGKMSASRKRAGSEPKAMGGADPPTMASVLRELGVLHGALSRQAVPLALMEQAFRQLTYVIAASSLNSLLLRKDVCCWSRGIQIRYNVSVLEEWLRSHNLQAGGAVAELEPLIQTAQLLQVGKKTEADAESLVETCNVLSSQQIVKILKLYTPHSDLEEKVTLNFLRSVLGVLKRRSDGRPPQLVMDAGHVFPVTFPYLPPPDLHADQLDIPDSLKISFLHRA
ncbi:Unconventional myosin-Vb [Merluccius polli]|uniref:Unconventional myosin-Vb n=1 Tax=Merluccius polli TaxID=89951 RepID=A0AA47NPK4_MERPO|nr:Unconventional myosin-Vb [Merluccius polli]